MAKSSTNPIPNLNTDWEFDPLNGMKYSGASVQAFIKQFLGAVSKAAFFDPNDYTLYFFASQDDKQEFEADQSKTGLVLFSTQMSFSSELFRIALVNNNNATQLNVATNEDNVELSIGYDVQTKAMTESAWRSTGKGVFVTTYIDINATGNYEQLTERRFMPAEQTFTVDVRNALEIGVNRVRVVFESEDDSSVIASITYTISLTEMFIEPLNNEWYKPIVEGGDLANYKLGGFRIVGAVSKTLHLDIYSGNQKVIGFEKLIGTTVYDRVPYYFIDTEGFDMSELNTGVYVVSAYLTSGTLTSKPINYNIMYIREEDKNTARLLCINNVEDLAYNYTTAKLFEYCIYNQGSVYGTLEATVRLLNGTATASTTVVPLENVTTGEAHPFNFPLEWLTEETLDLHVQVTMDYGNEQIATIKLDNSATFPPTYGYEFYLNAAARNNTDANKTKIVNFVTGDEFTPTWQNMTWMKNIDGWTDDDTGRPCLLIPARSKVVLPYTDYRIISGENISIEICYKVSNVTDYDENIITICNNPDIPNFRGIRIKPCNITVHSSEDSSATNDVKRGTNLMDERVVHFVLTIYKDFNGNSGRNLVTGYINGCKNFQFSYQTGTLWQTDADLVIGAERSDISLYFIRVYRSVLSDAAVQANYINSMPTISQREELQTLLKSVMDISMSNIDYKSVKDSNKNFFVIEMAGGMKVPSRKDGWDKEQTGLSTIEMHFGEHPSWDWKIENVETGGQGTTSMNYFLWNLRWRIDKTSGKKANVRYLDSRRLSGGSYVYDWGEANLVSSVNFDGAGNHPAVKRITAKINFASSMQSHKIGATWAYTELHDAIGLKNEAQRYAELNDLPMPTVSVYQYPVYGFEKRGNTYSFIGLFTIGPDKNDKSTFGLDINSTIKNNLIRMEGTDHSRKMVMFNYPWNNDVQYLASNECINIVKGANDYDNGWEVSACHGLDTGETDDQNAINEILAGEDGFKPAYNVAYENSTLIIGVPLGVYGATAEATLEYINSHIATFQAQLDDDNRMTYANYQFWIEGEYILYYYDIKTNQYVADIDLVEQNGTPEGETVDDQNEWFKAQRRERFKVDAQAYWNIPECIYHMDFCVFIGAMDNFGKNTYPYKMGDKFCWDQDDLDSIWGIGNAGADNMPTWMEFQDSDNGSVYFGGSTSVFWNLIKECYMDDYIDAENSAIRPGIISIGKQMLNAMSNLAGGTNTYDGIMKYIKMRFWDNAQDYFPQSAYNADAALKYESAWISNGQEVEPLSQSLGNHYSAEEYWIRKRVIYMMSFFKAGPFGSYADGSLGRIAFRPQSLQTLTVTPSTDLYPALASGQGMVSTKRTMLGQNHTFIGPFGTDGQTDHRINASNLLFSLGDLKDLRLGSQYIENLKVEGSKLITFKIGDEDALIIITPAVHYTQQEVDDYNAELEGAFEAGVTLTAEDATLINGVLGTSYEANDVLSDGDAGSYNATLEGAISTEDEKTPAETEPNVTTNVPSLSFDNTKCIEKIDARNAEAISGTVDISVCSRLKEAYFEGTSLTQVLLANGHRIVVLHLPETTTSISLKNLKLLEEIVLPENSGNISLLNVENCDINAFSLLNEAYRSENSELKYVRLIFDDIQQITRDELLTICGIGANKDKDGNAKVFNGVTESGAPSTTSDPLVEGTFTMKNGVYADDLEILDIQDEEDYEGGLKKALTGYFGARLFIIYNPNQLGIRFADSAVEAICLDHWDTNGDGVLSTLEARAVTNLSTYFRGNTQITSFDELRHFTGLTSIYGNNSSPYGAFAGCTALESIIIPSSVTSIGAYAFRGCSNLKGSFNIPNVTLNDGSFGGCSKITSIIAKASTSGCINGAGNGTGTVKLIGNVTAGTHSSQSTTPNFVHYIIQGNFSGQGSMYLFKNSAGKSVRISGNFAGAGFGVLGSSLNNCEFFELMGRVTSGNLFYQNYTLKSGGILHLGYNGIALQFTSLSSSDSYRNNIMERITKIYVGDGSSQEHDQAILDQYLADSAWSAYSSKLDLWWNYDGPYKED